MSLRLCLAILITASATSAEDVFVPLDLLGIAAGSTVQMQAQPMVITDNQLPLPMGKAVALTIIKDGNSTELPPVTIVDETTGSAEPAWSLDEPIKSADGITTVVGFFQSASPLQITQARAEMSAKTAAMTAHTVTHVRVTDPKPEGTATDGMAMISGRETIIRRNMTGTMKKISQETVCTVSADGATAPAIRARTTNRLEGRLAMNQKPIAGRPLIRCWVRIAFKIDEATSKDDETNKKAKADAERTSKDADALIDKQTGSQSEKK